LKKEEEIATLNSIEEEMLKATEKEPFVIFKDLDIDTWAKKTGLSEVAERLKNKN
jgi:hypothetical protein